ncbi:MAG: RNA polymerase subunit sigma-24, partial [Candidatus Dormibacteraeota bacterium]|nr:RNA polymerase subunit sigma-24 [Candidatus Dormibacteraeota bacterium]
MEDPSGDEAETVDRARRGDASAYADLVQRYTEMAFRTAYLVTGSAADAEDAAQDAFVKAYRALPRFRPG